MSWYFINMIILLTVILLIVVSNDDQSFLDFIEENKRDIEQNPDVVINYPTGIFVKWLTMNLLYFFVLPLYNILKVIEIYRK